MFSFGVMIPEQLFGSTKNSFCDFPPKPAKLSEGGFGGLWIPQHHKKNIIKSPHHQKKSRQNIDTALYFQIPMINMVYMGF